MYILLSPFLFRGLLSSRLVHADKVSSEKEKEKQILD